MEFTKDIYFNDSLKAGKESKITYSGSLFQNGSNNVNIVYGFGEDWNNTTTKPMEKQENGFVASIRMRDFDTFNFCFSNGNNIWDNNNNFNYISPILPENIKEEVPENQPVQTDNQIEFGIDYSSSIDEIIDDILENTAKQDIINSKNEISIDNFLESINNETLPEIEALFNDLFFESVKEDEKAPSVSEISMEPELAEELEEVGKAVNSNLFTSEENTSNNNYYENDDNEVEILKQIDELFSPIKNEEKIDNSVTTSQEIFSDTTSDKINDNLYENTYDDIYDDTFDNTELIKQFEELFEISNTPINFEPEIEEQTINQSAIVSEPAKLNLAEFNLDGLVSDLLNPVINSEIESEKIEETSLFEDIKSHEEDTNNSLALVNSGNFIVSSKKLGYFYKIKKRIRLVFIKLAKAKRNFVKQLGL